MDSYHKNKIIITQKAKFMGPTWVLSAQDGPHVGPMNLVIRVSIFYDGNSYICKAEGQRVGMNFNIKMTAYL